MTPQEETLYPGDLTREQVQEHVPLGWRWHLTQIVDRVERWQLIAQATGEMMPSLSAFERAYKPIASDTVIPWLHWQRLPVGRDDDCEFEIGQLESIQFHMKQLLTTCESCGLSGLLRQDTRGTGGYLVLCDKCCIQISGWQLSDVCGEIGGPKEPLVGRGGAWSPSYDDRDWLPGRDEEDDMRDGEYDVPF